MAISLKNLISEFLPLQVLLSFCLFSRSYCMTATSICKILRGETTLESLRPPSNDPKRAVLPNERIYDLGLFQNWQIFLKKPLLSALLQGFFRVLDLSSI
ncbi:hypothetical protein CPB84DRAFT_812445 [Gymnopilus junonius]|uniref:Uncharacterized protein n=1 Tax=Gymnopilus junonius TaxID=109634 RepID=A0A9P5N8K0_GYMJU|nr:hypothetical protein CPB84DRAFT_812445 [Gymnopilus junonius]